MQTLPKLAILALICGANALNNGLARTPPMGWRSWNAYGAKINQDLMENAAEMMVDNSRGFSLKGGASISPAPFASCLFHFFQIVVTRGLVWTTITNFVVQEPLAAFTMPVVTQ